MTNSDDGSFPSSVIDRIKMLLAEQRLHEAIDAPLDEAAASFQPLATPTASRESFHRVLGDFVTHVYERGLPMPKKLSRQQALAEAIALLEAGYQGVRCYGYEGAYRDAMDPALDGTVLVLSELNEIIKTIEREKYLQWVFAEVLAPLDWLSRCRVAQTLLDQLRPFLPAEVLRFTPAQLADEIHHLITADLENGPEPQHGVTLASMFAF